MIPFQPAAPRKSSFGLSPVLAIFTSSRAIDAVGGRVTVRYQDDGKEKSADEKMSLPADLANGIVLTLLKNASPVWPR